MKKIFCSIVLVFILIFSCGYLISIRYNSKMKINKNQSERVVNAEEVQENNLRQDKIIISKDEVNSMDALYIRTYDGKNQLTHPKVLYFNKPWHGWKYWMVFTPYPYSNDDYENPSIVVSDDGYSWTKPKELKNPLTGIPKDVARGGHYSDPHLVMKDNIMELWYRYNPAKEKCSGPNNGINIIFRVKSKDGINWSAPELVFNDKNNYLSPVIIYEESKYKIWFTNYNGDMKYRESNDAKSWTDAKLVNIKLPGHNSWHQDIIKTDIGYEIIFCAYAKGKFQDNNQELYYSKSKNGIDFEKPIKIISPSKEEYRLDNKMIYRSSILKMDGIYKIYYSAMDKKRRWHLFLTEGSDITKLKGYSEKDHYDKMIPYNYKANY